MRERFTVFRGPNFDISWRKVRERIPFDVAHLQRLLGRVNVVLTCQADDDAMFAADADGLRQYRVPMSQMETYGWSA
jgi:hypothetical protein